MASTLTTELSLVKATPGTHEPFSTAVINSNYDLIDAKFNNSTGHKHDSAHNGALIPFTGMTNPLVSPHFTTPVVDSGGITITAGDITIGAAASRIIAGATSFSVRDNTNAADNLLVAQAGLVTIRNGLTMAGGDILMPAGAGGMTGGFVYIPSAAADPSGTPGANNAGRAPLYFAQTSSKLFVYDFAASTWRGVVVS